VLSHDDEALVHASSIQGRDDFPSDVADALAALSLRDAEAYESAVRSVIRLFVTRDEYLEVKRRSIVDTFEFVAAFRTRDLDLRAP
jgi:hypothetical protein